MHGHFHMYMCAGEVVPQNLLMTGHRIHFLCPMNGEEEGLEVRPEQDK